METLPYELLVRWNQEGAVAGAHIRHLTLYKNEAGEVIQSVEGEPRSLSVADAEFEALIGSLVIDQQLQLDHANKIISDLREQISRLEAGRVAEPEPVAGPDLSGLLNELVRTPYFAQAKQGSYDSLPINTEFTLLMGGLTSTELSLENRIATVLGSVAALAELLGLSPEQKTEIDELLARYGLPSAQQSGQTS